MKFDARALLRGAAIAGAIAVACVTTADPAAAIDPKTKAELDAVQVRILQSEMMVAALTCDLHEPYNTVIEAHGSELKQHAGVLKSMFRRQHGSAAQHALDVYVTRLANDASMRSIRTRSTFCASAMTIFEAALEQDMTLARIGGVMVQQAAAPLSADR